MRILFYAVNGLGLGHVTRLLSIARRIRKRKPDWDILFLTSSESNAVYKEGFTAVKVPSKNIAHHTGLSTGIHLNILHQTAWSLFSSFQPHVTVVDTFPGGFAHELDQVLRWHRSRFVYIYRQRKEEKAKEPWFQALLKRYDLILVPHSKGVSGVSLPPGVETKFTGPILIRDKKELLTTTEIKKRFSFPHDKKLLLVTLGGGGQHQLDKTMEQITTQLHELQGIHPVIARGSLLRESGCNSEYTTIHEYYPLCELFNAFDGALAACGYNTVNELIHFGVPSLFIPFERTVDDQHMRAHYMAKQGLGLYCESIHPADINKSLSILFEEKTHAGLRANLSALKQPSGAMSAARAIIKLAGKR